MADRKISELSALTGANSADDDVLVIVDTSADETKKITLGELENALAERDFSFGDNDKLVFGAGSDLQIYHDGSNSYIDEAGTGDLVVLSSTRMRFEGKTTGDTYMRLNENSSVQLYHDNTIRLTTTSTGIDVTGTITASGSVIAEGNSFQGVSSQDSLSFGAAETPSTLQVRGDLTVDIDSNNNGTGKSFKITNNGQAQNLLLAQDNGDISFYEDTGTTAKFFWDASAEVLGLGTTSPNVFANTGMHIHDATTSRLHMTNGTTGSTSTDGYEIQVFEDDLYLLGREASGDIVMYPANSEAMRITSSGSVGIGTTSPSSLLHLNSAYPKITLNDTQGVNRAFSVGTNNETFTVRNETGSTDALVIDNNNNVGIGTTSPETNLHIENASSFSIIRLVGSTTETVGVDFGDPDDRDIGRVRYNNSDNSMVFHTNAAEHMRIDSSGNVGIGVVPSAWASNYSVLEGVNGQSISFTGNTPSFTSNGYFTGTAWTYKTSNYASNYYQYAGQHIWRTAPSGTAGNAISFSEAMRIDSSGNVGIGTSSPSFGDSAQGLEVKRSGGNVTVRVNYDGSAQGQFTATSSSIKLETRTSGIPLVFGTAAVERMRIDSSGNLLVGKTSAVGASTVGAEMRPDGDLISTRSGAQPLTLNRTTSDGDIAQFRKDNATVGSIGSANSGVNLFIAGTTAGIKITNDNTVSPASTTGANSDADTDLGASSNRFKDLYLSGGVYLGGTGASNLLDDYEEGTWTPTLVGATTAVINTIRKAKYTKIGDMVTVFVDIELNTNSDTGVFAISVPFVANADTDTSCSGVVGYSTKTTADNPHTVRVASSSSGILVTNGATVEKLFSDYSAGRLGFTVSYFT